MSAYLKSGVYQAELLYNLVGLNPLGRFMATLRPCESKRHYLEVRGQTPIENAMRRHDAAPIPVIKVKCFIKDCPNAVEIKGPGSLDDLYICQDHPDIQPRLNIVSLI